jgi:glycosyltransferase involved in cell wall biosynthesis
LKPCLLIPIYDQPGRIGDVVSRLEPLRLPLLLVDDGSGPHTRAVVDALAARTPWLTLIRRERNGGRGAALKTGYRAAHACGYTHALQLDADGQHDPSQVPALLEAARQDPKALVLGVPVFDASAPASRLYGRWICRAWVWIETLSWTIRDPLCGLRCIPLEPMRALLDERPLADRMEFDVELVVRLAWEGVPVRSVEVQVRYFDDGVSHYRVLRDNWLLSRLHARLCSELLGRALRGSLPRAAVSS